MLSIITPTLNGAKWIEKNIASVQSLSIPFEHIVVDGGSTDETLNILAKYPHIRVVHQTEKNGMYHAIDLGFRHSKGDIITWVNCDDQVVKSGYEKMYRYLCSNEKCGFVYSDGLVLYQGSDRTRYLKGAYFAKYFLGKGIFPLCQPSSMFRRSLYDQCEGFDFRNFRVIGDYDLFLRMSRNHYEMKYLPYLSSLFLVHDSNLSDTGAERATDERNSNGLPVPSRYHNFIFSLLISEYFPHSLIRFFLGLNAK